MKIKISDIKTENRFRQDLGNLQELADSIKAIGLLQPIGIKPDYTLIFGQRRIEAVKLLGGTEIEANIIDIANLIKGEVDENTVRKDFTMSERNALKAVIEPEIREAAKEQQKIHGGTAPGQEKNTCGDSPQVFGETRNTCGGAPQVFDKTRDKVSNILGIGYKKLKQEEYIMEHADKTTIDLVDSGEISTNAGFKKVRQAEREKENTRIKETKTKAFKESEYQVIVVDPPWPLKKILRDVRPNQTSDIDYPTMTLEEISELSIPASDDCHLFLWTTNKFLPVSLDILKSWGFRYTYCMVWHKPGGFQPVGLPQYNAEFILYARKGTPKFVDTKNFPICFNAARGAHSVKPEEFYQTIKRVTEGKRLDMFGRRKIEGFESWGFEA